MNNKPAKFYTACPRNCYSTCSLIVNILDGKIISIEGNPDNKATSLGPCLKGLAYFERIHSSERLLFPLLKNRENNIFERISWEQALDLISQKLLHFKAIYGAKSIMYYAGSGSKGVLNSIAGKFWNLFGGCTTTYGDLCWPAGLEATRLTLGKNEHNTPWDISNSRLIIIWGKNSSETNIHQTVFIEQAIEKGAKLIVIDPRRTQTAERSDLLLQPRPGTDGALALGIANFLVQNNLIDNEFVSRYVKGFDEFSEVIKHFTLEKSSEITDIPVRLIEKTANLIASIKPMTINAGFGMQRYTNSGQTMRAIIALVALTGNIGKSGAGWMFANLQSHIFNHVKDPIDFYPPEEDDGIARISISTARLGKDMLLQDNPPLKMIWVERGNPLVSNPETSTVIEAFKKLEFRVVVDEFLTDTAKEADLVLPAKTFFEQNDIINAYWHPYIQLREKVLDTPGEVKPETEIYYLLAKKLGYSESKIETAVPNPEKIIDYLKNRISCFPEINFQEMETKPILSPEFREIAFSDYIFPTPSGKIEIYSDEAKERWNVNPLPLFTEPKESNRTQKKYPIHLLTPNTKNRIHTQFNNLTLIKQFSEKPFITIHPANAAERNISGGDTVIVFNDRGKIELVAKVDFSIKKGCASITNGWQEKEGVCVNYLSLGRETDMGYGAAFHDNLVEIKKYYAK